MLFQMVSTEPNYIKYRGVIPSLQEGKSALEDPDDIFARLLGILRKRIT